MKHPFVKFELFEGLFGYPIIGKRFLCDQPENPTECIEIPYLGDGYNG